MQSSLLHLTLGICVCIASYLGMYWIFYRSDLWALVVSGILGSISPDLDKLPAKIMNIHRHLLLHSSFFAVLGFIYAIAINNTRFIDVFYLALALSTHLFSDLKPGKEGKKLSYLIYIKHGNRMSAKHTDQYLISNGLICIVIALLCVLATAI